MPASLELVRIALQAYGNGDCEIALALADPLIRWDERASRPDGDLVWGHDDVAAGDAPLSRQLGAVPLRARGHRRGRAGQGRRHLPRARQAEGGRRRSTAASAGSGWSSESQDRLLGDLPDPEGGGPRRQGAARRPPRPGADQAHHRPAGGQARRRSRSPNRRRTLETAGRTGARSRSQRPASPSARGRRSSPRARSRSAPPGPARSSASGPPARRPRRLGLRADRLGGELGRLGRALADADALRLERLLLRLGGAGGAGDDRPGVAHLLAGRAR